jgi:6-phosphogluconolactonase
MSDIEIVRSESDDELARSVADRLVARLVEAQADGREPQIGLTGGTIAVQIHEAVVTASRGSGLDWSKVVVWWGDERFVPADDPERNARQARDALLDHVDVDPAKVHEMPASDAGFADVDAASASYAQELREHGAGEFDVLMLGVGPDGHCASLFPGFPQLDVDDAIAVGVTGSPKPPPERVSLTFPALNRSREVWFVVAGDGKADAVAKALSPDADIHDTPASGVHGSRSTTWFLDPGSASQLPDR